MKHHIRVANTVCTTILFTLVLNASIVHYPFMQRKPSIWKMNLFRTLAVFLAPTVIEFGTEVYLYRLDQEKKTDVDVVGFDSDMDPHDRWCDSAPCEAPVPSMESKRV